MKFGQVKCTFGTGCFLLYNTGIVRQCMYRTFFIIHTCTILILFFIYFKGDSIVHSESGLLTTVAYKLGPNSPPVYALEGSVAIAGKDNISIYNFRCYSIKVMLYYFHC